MLSWIGRTREELGAVLRWPATSRVDLIVGGDVAGELHRAVARQEEDEDLFLPQRNDTVVWVVFTGGLG
jgi:hypothetical protein